ncbi:MAG: hypothetical protein AAGG59_04580 [Bacteroidota bacterium]
MVWRVTSLPLYILLGHFKKKEWLIVPKLTDIVNSTENDINYWLVIFGFCVLAPVIEEIAFRLFIVWNKKYLILSISLILSAIPLKIFGFKFIGIQGNAFIQYFSYLFLGLLVYVLLSLLTKKKDWGKIKIIWQKRLSLIMILSALAFGVFHYSRSLQFINWYSFIVWLLPFILFAYFLMYARIKYTIYGAITLHMLANVITMAISL